MLSSNTRGATLCTRRVACEQQCLLRGTAGLQWLRKAQVLEDMLLVLLNYSKTTPV